MFQVAMLSVSSSLDEGILALAILDLRAFRPLAISGETVPWFMVLLPANAPLQCTPAPRAFERPPDAVGRRRHVEVPYIRLTKRIGDRVHDRRQRAADSGLAHAFRAERIGSGRDRVLLDGEAADETRAGHRVVHEAAGEELAGLRIVYSHLPEDLPRALGDAALHLAFDDLVVDDVARVVHRREADDLGDARLGLNLDLGDMAAVRIGHSERLPCRRGRD